MMAMPWCICDHATFLCWPIILQPEVKSTEESFGRPKRMRSVHTETSASERKVESRSWGPVDELSRDRRESREESRDEPSWPRLWELSTLLWVRSLLTSSAAECSCKCTDETSTLISKLRRDDAIVWFLFAGIVWGRASLVYGGGSGVGSDWPEFSVFMTYMSL